jgi:signal transduction histidine kinase
MPIQKDSAHLDVLSLKSQWEGGNSQPEANETVQSDDLLNEVLRLRRKQRHSISGLGTTVHYMKSSLSVIEGYLQLLASGRPGTLTDVQRDCLRGMHGTTVRLQQLTSELLTYSFWSSNTRKLRFKTGDIQSCLERAYKEWVTPYEAKDVDFKFEIPEKIPPFPFESPGVERLVACLLDNALKFTPVGKSVLLTVKPYFWERRLIVKKPPVERRRSNSQAPNSALISVIDTGAGIPSECQQEIFEDFYTAGVGDVKPGTGLGLAIARYVVEMHAGKIWVESTVGVGSRFCVVLPYSPVVKLRQQVPSQAT